MSLEGHVPACSPGIYVLEKEHHPEQTIGANKDQTRSKEIMNVKLGTLSVLNKVLPFLPVVRGLPP